MRRVTPEPPINPPEPTHYCHEHLEPDPDSIEWDGHEVYETWHCMARTGKHRRCEATALAFYRCDDDAWNGCPATDHGQHVEHEMTDIDDYDSENHISIEFACVECGEPFVVRFDYDTREIPSV